ncbi:MAG: cysteine desulfurase [Acidobacteriota bacterium]|nr:MAG: cysteine desulfurase [Acidobacteriota bacterium]
MDVDRLRGDFPILSSTVYGKPLVYLDNAATTQKPAVVIETLRNYYEQVNSNIHRGVHHLSQVATDEYEKSRRTVQRFLNARKVSEIVFVRGTTEGVNLIAQTFGRSRLAEGDEVVISAMEHHSNIVPWQMVCEQMGARLKVIPMNDRGELLIEKYAGLLGPRTKLVSFVHVSNALGTVNPAREMIQLAHERGIPVVLDGAQSLPHLKVDVQELDVDFFVFSGHKAFGPTGIGAVYGKLKHLEAMPPYQGGGDMISSVSFEKTTYNEVPHKFEAGTPNIAGAIGLGASLEYLAGLDLDVVAGYEEGLVEYAHEALLEVPGLRLIGTAEKKAGVVSFVLESVHPHDIGTILDREGVAIRTGHHCAQPVMDFYGVPATARASFAFYNKREEIDILVQGLGKAIEVFR